MGIGIPNALMQAVMQYAGQPDDQSTQPGQTPNRLLRAVKSAAAAPPEEKHPDHTEPDPASRTASGAATLPSGGPVPEERPMHDRLSELESQYDRASQPIAQPDTKHRLLNFAIEAAPAALAPIVGRHGNYGAAEGVAKGVEGGVTRNQNLAENELNRATGVQQQNKNRLMQAMENESRLRTTERGQDTRAQLAEQGLTERARLQKEAEDARWKGLTATIQGRKDVADTNQQGVTGRNDATIAGRAVQGAANRAQARDLAKIHAANQMDLAKFHEDHPTGGGLTAQSRAMGEMATTVQGMVPGIQSEVDALADKIGPGIGRWNELWVNKGGMNDPDFAGLDTDLDLFASALVRTHFGARGGQSYREALKKQFSEAQSPEDLLARIAHADTWIQGYAKMAGGGAGAGGAGAPNRPAAAPAPGAVTHKFINGRVVPVTPGQP